MSTSATAGPSTVPVDVLYCGICSLPAEYCEFSPTTSKCKSWLESNHHDEWQRLYSEGAVTSRLENMEITSELKEKLETEAAKAERKAERKAESEAKKRQAAKITIKSESRTKRKTTTHVHGLEAFGVDLKKAAKFLAGKFATGSSVSKNPQGLDEIVVQGDVAEEIVSRPYLKLCFLSYFECRTHQTNSLSLHGLPLTCRSILR